MNNAIRHAMLVPLLAVVFAAGAAACWSGRLAVGVLAGGLWNIASLWCLGNLLAAWLGPKPSQRRAIGWLLLKFPLLYALAFLILRMPTISLIGFGIGFTITLAAMMVMVRRTAARRTEPVHG